MGERLVRLRFLADPRVHPVWACAGASAVGRWETQVRAAAIVEGASVGNYKEERN